MPTINGNAASRQERRRRLYEKQAGRCHWCAKMMTLEQRRYLQKDYATFEHLKPRCQGGKSNYDNVVLACYRCNAKRGNSADGQQKDAE
jgi:5-methylcytosine-specific restriction endonuclease McrA